MSRRTRFASDLALSPRGCERAGMSAARHAACVAMAWCALSAGFAAAATPVGQSTGGLLLSAYDTSSQATRPSPTTRPGPGESTFVVVSDEDSQNQPTNNSKQPAQRWIGPPQVESHSLGSAAMFADLPEVEATNVPGPQSPAETAKPAGTVKPASRQPARTESVGTSDRSTNSSANQQILRQLLDGQLVVPAVPAKSQRASGTTSSGAEASGWFQQFAGAWPFGQSKSSQPTKDPFGPPSAQFAAGPPSASPPSRPAQRRPARGLQ